MRARLNERLEYAARFPVTLIVAPAGFGKSVALHDFLAHARMQAVRYDVRREDSTLLAFVRSFSEAIKTIAPSAIAAFPAMQERVLATEEPVRQISDWLVEHLKGVRTVIAIDDLHYAAADPASIALLADLIERSDDRIKWIIAARSDAGLPVATWIAYGRMDIPIGEDDLRFTTDEALSAAEQIGPSRLDLQEVEALRQLTEGWPVALTIALRTRTYAADLRSAAFGTREMIYRYLAEQVFSELTPEQRSFALASCVFSSFDRDIAQDLGGTPESLTELRAKLAFLTEDASGDYRYHDLFRDFLDMELRRSGEDEWRRTVCAGARILEKRERPAEALTLYTKARAADEVLRILRHSGIALFERGESEPLSAALAFLPETRRRADAAALGLQAMLDAGRGNFELAQPAFTAAIAAAADPDLRLAIVHRYAIELVRNGKDCVDLLEPYANDEHLEPALRVPLLATLATAYLAQREIPRAMSAIESALVLQVHSGDDVRARVFQQAAHVFFQDAATRDRAERYARMAIEAALRQNLYEVAARAYSVLYNLKYDNDDLLGSLEILERLQDCARKAAATRTWLYGVMASYDIQAEMGNEKALQQLDATLEEHHASLPPETRGETLLPALALREAWRGDFNRAFRLLAGSAFAQRNSERRALRAAETALYAMSAGLQDEGDSATDDARHALEGSDASKRTVRARLLMALAEIVRGRLSSAHRLISAAEHETRANMSRLRALCDAVRTLYRVQMQQADAPALLAALERLRLEQFGGYASLLDRLPLGSAGEQAAFGTLTPAEREILLLLAKGASTKDVANKTGRSPHTVDTHIRSICRKLGCSGRREAVALATNQGWVQT
jgi:ATP/maltotriose-dependent transcriptional regulator MalT